MNLECQVCTGNKIATSFYSLDDLQAHLFINHHDGPLDVFQFVCHKCEFKFGTEYRLLKHEEKCGMESRSEDDMEKIRYKLQMYELLEVTLKYNMTKHQISGARPNPSLDNDTTVEVFKYLNYCQLAKTSLVSKRFSDLIRTHRHKLALLYVESIGMSKDNYDPAAIKNFDQELSPEAYNEWVIRNDYSKQIPLETQIARIQSTHCDRKVYRLHADADYHYTDSNPSFKEKSVFSASIELSHENWPVFQHFIRLLTDPFIHIRSLGLPYQNDALNLLAGAVNQDRGRLQCRLLGVSLQHNMQDRISWIKEHVFCSFKIAIMGPQTDMKPKTTMKSCSISL
ncbi:hypothetical protein Ddc_15779 [Ditylenchus destructor]|nr:hypothetical protein Ddc_15779 [Ditylenchus destructor]